VEHKSLDISMIVVSIGEISMLSDPAFIDSSNTHLHNQG